MKKVKVLFCNEVALEDERRIKLDYYLTECCAEEGQSDSYYGIGIKKHLEGETETEEISGISYSQEEVVAIMKKMFHNTVTPISMVDVLDDLVSETWHT